MSNLPCGFIQGGSIAEILCIVMYEPADQTVFRDMHFSEPCRKFAEHNWMQLKAAGKILCFFINIS